LGKENEMICGWTGTIQPKKFCSWNKKRAAFFAALF
jgi:hypothetical protein